MNKHKTKKTKSYNHHLPETSRRVSFSKTSRFSTASPLSVSPLEECSKHEATNKHCSTSRPIFIPNSRPSKSSLKQGNQQSKTIGVSTRTRKRDSSTKLDPRLLSPNPNKHGNIRRSSRDETISTPVVSQNDPTPIHLKYGTFRKLSKLRTPSRDSNISQPSTRRESRPVLVAISSVQQRLSSSSPRQSMGTSTATGSPVERARPMRPSNPAVEKTILPPPKATRGVYLTRTDTMHIDIKPKKFPSMLWC